LLENMISKVVSINDQGHTFQRGAPLRNIWTGVRVNDGRSGSDPTVCYTLLFNFTIAQEGTFGVCCSLLLNDCLFRGFRWRQRTTAVMHS
jgi:hypothetical protein